jgi:hypothetical protein
VLHHQNGKHNKMGVCYIVALPFTLKTYLNAKEELWETQIFHHNKNITFKKSSKGNQNPSKDINYNSIITKSRVSTRAKISSFKNPHIIKIDLLLLLLLLLPRGL